MPDTESEKVKDPEIKYETCEFAILQFQRKCLALYKEVKAIQKCTYHDAKIFDDRLQALRMDFKYWEKKLVIACSYLKDSQAHYDKHQPRFEDAEKHLDHVQMYVTQMQDSVKSAATAAAPPPTSTHQFKLERIKIPTFSGKFSEREEYRDLFTAAVENNKSLTGAEKMVYLKTSMSGDALAIIISFSTTQASYTAAWDLVKERYANPREIAFSHLKKLFDLAPANDTASDLRKVLDLVNELTRSLANLTIPVDKWDIILVFWILKKLSDETRREWLLLQKKDLPTLKGLLEFLDERARALDDSLSKTKSKSGQSQSSSKSAHTASTFSKRRCVMCNKDHLLFQCEQFLKKSVNERWNFIKEKKVCSNCLRSGHDPTTCKNPFSCKKCDKRHNTLLQSDPKPNSKPSVTGSIIQPQAEPRQSTSSSLPVVESTQCSYGTVSCAHVLLETAIVNVLDSTGNHLPARLFVDKGSEAEFVTEDLVRKLGFSPKGRPVNVTGLGGVSCGATMGNVKLTLSSKTQKFTLPIIAEVMDKVTRGNLPQFQCKGEFPHLKGLKLADPDFMNPAPVDIILGARYASRIKIGGIIHGPRGTPSAEETKFGWLISGSVPLLQNHHSSRIQSLVASTSTQPNPSANSVEVYDRSLCTTNQSLTTTDRLTASGGEGPCSVSPRCTYDDAGDTKNPNEDGPLLVREAQEEDPLDLLLTRFWETEEPSSDEVPRSIQNEECEDIFISTTHRTPDGRYIVSLPFRKDNPSFGDSLVSATRRFASVERRKDRNPSLAAHYKEYFQSHLGAGVMEKIPPEEVSCDPNKCYYMPYTTVEKPTSTTTKIRTVFDCSAKTAKGGPSLNDVLYPGPKLQVDLIPLLIRFRSYTHTLSADIVKFFNQILVERKHWDYQRLVYRETPTDPIDHYRMTRVTFGVTSAPFLAIRTLQQLFDDECDDPEVKRIIKEDTLVDNILTGSFSNYSSLLIQQKLIQVMEKGQLELRKWASNLTELLESIPLNQREAQYPLTISDAPSPGLATLGLNWYPNEDYFTLLLPKVDLGSTQTKRTVLSLVAKVFDPLGWVSPVTIRTKILLQELWKAKLDWDTPLPTSFLKKWEFIAQDFKKLSEIKIPRCYSNPREYDTIPKHQLLGFSDASNAAYSAVIYMRTVTCTDDVKITLVGSKTKVAPVKGETTPRLELNGARLLASFMKTVKDSVRVPIDDITCWSDSTSVIGQLTSTPNTEKKEVYVRNRVRYIQNTIPNAQWFHVDGEENPADCASRGISSNQLLNHPLWYTGPSWLREFVALPPKEAYATSTKEIADEDPFLKLTKRISSYTKMIRITGWCLRFINNAKIKAAGFATKEMTELTVGELKESLHTLVKAVQAETFTEEIASLISSQEKPPKKLKFLTPFLDEENLLRVGGRIRKAKVAMEKKHPLLLPKNHSFTIAVARHYHNQHQHAGPTLLLCLIREKFWIYHGPTLIKKIVRSCVTCHRHNPKPLSQVMSDLPKSRVNYTRPFTRTGMDFAGPFFIATVPGRKPRIQKSYLCIFVCMAVKAVHLELVGDLSTPSFIAALKRFVSRRGLPEDLYSDGGKNFVGAKAELDKVIAHLTSQDLIEATTRYCSLNGIRFNFNPPLSPHHGGLYEAAVKSTKFHLSRIIEDRQSIEEMNTLLCLVEAILNSRPLVPMSDDPSDVSALTPGNFLVGGPLLTVPEGDLTEVKVSPLKRWSIAQQIAQKFWKKFHLEYLQTLQSRPKWLKNLPNIQPGVLVLVKELDAAFTSSKWNLARVTLVFPGSDGQVRVVEIKTATGSTFRRPIVKISPLPLQ